jgi:hypothetical protein
MSLESFHDLQNSTQLDEKLSYEFLITLLDKIFGQHDTVQINADIENEHNHSIILLQWKMIKQYYNLPSSVKNTQKLVRQTLMQISNRLNKKYNFQKPLKFEQKRHDYYDTDEKRKLTDYWSELSLV